MNQVVRTLLLSSRFEKLAAREYIPAECECGHKWEVLAPRRGKYGLPPLPDFTCPKCGERGFSDISRKHRIELDPDIQAPELSEGEIENIRSNMPGHLKELTKTFKPKFHEGQKIEYQGITGRVIDPLVHHQKEFDVSVPEQRLVMVQFNHRPYGHYSFVKEQDLKPFDL